MKRLICFDIDKDPPEVGQEVWLYTGNGTMVLVSYDPEEERWRNFKFWHPKPEYPAGLFHRRMLRKGYKYCEPDWEIIRGAYTKDKILEVVIDRSGKGIFFKSSRTELSAGWMDK